MKYFGDKKKLLNNILTINEILKTYKLNDNIIKCVSLNKCQLKEEIENSFELFKKEENANLLNDLIKTTEGL
jgi:hypothetical protein